MYISLSKPIITKEGINIKIRSIKSKIWLALRVNKIYNYSFLNLNIIECY